MLRLLALALIVLPAAAQAEPCPGYSSSGITSITDLDRFYGEQAIAVLRAGMMRDNASLDALVRPDVAIDVWRGDTVWSPRGEDRNTLGRGDAVIALTNLLRPRSFTLLLAQPGPIGLMNSDRCERAIKLIVAMTEPGQAASLDFTFRDGKLASITGWQMGLVEGSLSQ